MFREPTAWERYSWQIALIIAVLLLQAGLIAALLRAHRQRQLAEVQSRAAHGRTCPCQPLLDGWRTDRLNCSRNQPAARINSDQRRNRRGNSEIPVRPDIIELKEIVNDILQDDRRATEVIRRMRSLLKKAPFEPKNSTSMKWCKRQSDLLSALAVGRQVRI